MPNRNGGTRSGNNVPGVREIDAKISTLQSARNILAADAAGGRGFGMSAGAGRGGARPGAGRPKGSANKGRSRASSND